MEVGRPSKYLPEYCQKAIDYIGSGHSVEAFASTIGVTRFTIYNWKNEFPEFAEAVAVGEDKRKALMESDVMALSREGKGSALNVFLLKNWGGMRDDYRFEHTGKDGGAIESKMDDKQMEQLAREYEDKLKKAIFNPVYATFQSTATDSITNSTSIPKE